MGERVVLLPSTVLLGQLVSFGVSGHLDHAGTEKEMKASRAGWAGQRVPVRWRMSGEISLLQSSS